MQNSWTGKWIWILGGIVAAWLGVRYLFPVILPFLLGTLIAFAAEPAVAFASKKLRLSRHLAAGLGVGLTLLLTVAMLWLLGAFAVRELGNLARSLPDMEQTAQQGITMIRDWVLRLTQRLPRGAQRFASDAAQRLLDPSTVLQGRLADGMPTAVRTVLGRLPGSALGIGTGVLAGFMISVRLPRLRGWLGRHLPDIWYERYLPALSRAGSSVKSWVKAQLKLSALTYAIVATGLLLLKVPYGLFWALPVAVVDAVPVLGTGTVLLPWALIALLQGDGILALGLVLTYTAALICRTVLEPKLVGAHLGLDPLVTLIALYAGFRLWGIAGMVLSPMLTAAVMGFVGPKREKLP